MRRRHVIWFAALALLIAEVFWWRSRPGSEQVGQISTPAPAKSSARSSSTAPAERAGTATANPTLAVEATTFPNLANVAAGTETVIPLPGGGEARGRVNLVVRDPDGLIRVGGELLGGRVGGFSLAGKGVVASGRVLIPAEACAYVISTENGGRLLVQERPLAELICFELPREPDSPMAAIPAEIAPQATPPLLSSRPAATAVLYLDFDGETVTDPDWNNGNPIFAAPSALSSSQITDVWNSVKEDFWPFNVDVTTDLTRYQNAPVGRRMRIIITPTFGWFGFSGGAAYIHSFAQAGTNGFNTNVPSWVFNTTVNGVAEAISHELGHTLGLEHDGLTTNPAPFIDNYYSGHGSFPVTWAPIMGTAYGKNVVQWSKGEYLNANNHEDDLAIIAGATNGFGFVPDDAGDSRATASNTGFTGEMTTVAGIISSTADVDFYRFSITGRAITVTAEPAAFSPNLDILLELQDANGNVLASANPDNALNASLTYTAATGTYYLKVQGTGRGDVLSDGYSSYGSIGYYKLTLATPYAFTHFAGAVGVSGLVDEIGNAARFNQPSGVAVDGNGNLYVADDMNRAVRKITPSGAVTTFADLSPNNVVATAVDNIGNVYAADSGYAIRRIGVGGVITTLAGPPDLFAPRGLAVDNSGNLYVADTFHDTIRKIGVDLAMTNVAGLGTAGSSDGTGISAQFFRPYGVAVDGNGNLYVADTRNDTIRKITPGRVVTTIAGLAGVAGSVDGPGNAARFNEPQALAVDGSGNIFVADSGNKTIRKIDPNGVVTTVGGVAGSTGSADGAGNAARFALPNGIAVDGNGNLFVGDTLNHTIRKGVRAILAAPAFSVTPVGLSRIAGQSAALSASASGFPFPSYQWYKGGLAIAGATSATLLLSDLQLGDAGSYFVTATNTEGVVSSPAVNLSVAPFVPVSITSQPASVTRLQGQDVTFSVNAAGSPPLSYQWTKDGAPIAGATAATYSLANLQPAAAAVYRVIVANAGSSVTSDPATLSVNVPPSISAQSGHVLVEPGNFVSLSATTSAIPAPTYQWYKDGVALPGEVADVIGINSVQLANAGNYTVTITNTAGSVSSAVSTIMVAPVTAPTIVRAPFSQVADPGSSTVFSVVAVGTGSLSYQWYKDDITFGSATSSPFLILPAVSTANAGSYRVVVSNSAGAVASTAATLQVNTAGTPPPNDNFATAQELVGNVGAAVGSNQQATYAPGEPSYGSSNVNATSIWYRWTPTISGLAVIDLKTANVDSVVIVYSGSSGSNLTQLASGTGPTGSAEGATFQATANTTYYVLVGSIGSSRGTIRLRYVVGPPAITSPPASIGTTIGQVAQFAVEATGAETLTYQWYKDGTKIENATNRILGIANAQSRDAGSYTVVVSNGAGSVISTPAALTVLSEQFSGTHAVIGGGYKPGETVTITNTITYAGALNALGWQVLLPAGWSFASASGQVGESGPHANDTSVLEWGWIAVPASPVTFTYTLNVPADQAEPKEIAALILPRQNNVQYSQLVRPDPLVINRLTFHTADFNHDGKLALTELLRVIELYNTRNSSVRTGAYAVDAANLEDGFATDPARTNTAVVTLAQYHSADVNHDGKLSLTELLRVIELYNFRNGSVRTGQYHAQAGTEDGFGAGP